MPLHKHDFILMLGNVFLEIMMMNFIYFCHVSVMNSTEQMYAIHFIKYFRGTWQPGYKINNNTNRNKR